MLEPHIRDLPSVILVGWVSVQIVLESLELEGTTNTGVWSNNAMNCPLQGIVSLTGLIPGFLLTSARCDDQTRHPTAPICSAQPAGGLHLCALGPGTHSK